MKRKRIALLKPKKQKQAEQTPVAGFMLIDDTRPSKSTVKDVAGRMLKSLDPKYSSLIIKAQQDVLEKTP